MTQLSEDQRVALAIIPKISSVFSLFGSIWIIIEVLTEKTKRGVPYHRLLLAMSIYDIAESVSDFLSTWPIPSHTEDAVWNIGNEATCTAQGFFLQLTIAAPLYNAMLSYYYVLVIKYNYTDRRLRSCVEPSMHIFCFVWSFGTALYAALAELMNNADLWCWIASTPHDCTGSWSIPEGEINPNPCDKGDNIWVYRFGFYFIPLWISIVVATVCTYIVYKYVYAQDMKTLRYRRPDRKVSMWGKVRSIRNRFSGGRTSSEAAPDLLKGKKDKESHPSTKDSPNNDDSTSDKTPEKPPTIDRAVSTGTGLGSVPEDSQADFQREASSSHNNDRQPSNLLVDNTPHNLSGSMTGFSEGRDPTGAWSISLKSANSVRSVSTIDSADVSAIQDELKRRAAKAEMEASERHDAVDTETMNHHQHQQRPRLVRQKIHEWKARREQYARDMPHTVEVFHQALFYLGAFYCTHIWSTTNRLAQAIGGDDASSFFLLVMHAFFDPFQGFLNFGVYQRPRYIQMRKKYPDLSFLQICRIILRFTYMGEYVIPKRKEEPQEEPEK